MRHKLWPPGNVFMVPLRLCITKSSSILVPSHRDWKTEIDSWALERYLLLHKTRLPMDDGWQPYELGNGCKESSLPTGVGGWIVGEVGTRCLQQLDVAGRHHPRVVMVWKWDMELWHYWYKTHLLLLHETLPVDVGWHIGWQPYTPSIRMWGALPRDVVGVHMARYILATSYDRCRETHAQFF